MGAARMVEGIKVFIVGADAPPQGLLPPSGPPSWVTLEAPAPGQSTQSIFPSLKRQFSWGQGPRLFCKVMKNVLATILLNIAELPQVQ